MSCWTLWQRMPPRYQLTMRDIPPDPHHPPQRTGTTPRASSASPPHSPRIRTPRGTRQASSSRRRPSGEDPALTRGVLGAEAEPRDVACSPVLPLRASAYIHNVKNQMRINSARRQLHEGSLQAVVPSTLSYSPKPRATTAPTFPITNPSNTEDYHRLTSPVPQRGRSGRRSPQPGPTGRREATRRSVPVSTLCPFGQSPPFPRAGQTSLCPRQASPVQHDCVIGEHQVAALYVDKGRVTFFRKTKPDVTQSVYSALSPYHVTCDDGSYLSHLRKAYLSGVRDLPKVMGREPDVEKHSTIRERMDYDRKVGRILDYYTQGDVTTEGRTPRPPNVPQSTPVSPFPAAQHAFRTLSSRRRHPSVGAASEHRDWNLGSRGSEASERGHSAPLPKGTRSPSPCSWSDTTAAPAQDQHHQTSSSNGGFVRINARAPLHSRHFYLHTPARHTCLPGTEPPQTESGCVCGLCRLEMEVALMAQLHQDLGVSVDAATAAHLRASLEKGAAMNRYLDLTDQAGMNVVGDQDDCSARPNFVSGSRPSAAPSQRPESVSQGSEARTVAGQHPCSGDVISTSTQTLPVVESTSLTVTLPVIEETSDIRLSQQDIGAEDSDLNNNAKLVEDTQQTMLLDSSQEMPTDIVKDVVKNIEQENRTSMESDLTHTGQDTAAVPDVHDFPQDEEPDLQDGCRPGPGDSATDVTEQLSNKDDCGLLRTSVGNHCQSELPAAHLESDGNHCQSRLPARHLESDGNHCQPELPARHLESDAEAKGSSPKETHTAEPQPSSEVTSVLEHSTPCVHGGGTVGTARESTSDASAEHDKTENIQNITAENHNPPDYLPPSSDTTTLGDGEPPVLTHPAESSIIVSMETPAPEQVCDVKEGQGGTSVGVHPPKIVVSLASDNEGDEPDDEFTT